MHEIIMKKNIYKLVNGDRFVDKRGIVSFVNDSHLDDIKRFYIIEHLDTKTIRAWQGHKTESKYFYCIKGSFRIAIIKTDNLVNPDKNTQIDYFDIQSSIPQILSLKRNSINGIRALENNSILLVFSDKSLEESKKDDHRWDTEYFSNWKAVFNKE